MGVLPLGISVQLSDSFTEFTSAHGRSLRQATAASDSPTGIAAAIEKCR
jgi:hypothetical protein